MKEIQLTKGFKAIVDDEDFALLNRWSWCAKPSGGKANWYAYNGKFGAMHRLIIKAPPGLMVDHINGDGLDNRKKNLRLATNSQNQANKKKILNKFGYKGVSKEKKTGKYFARIKKLGREIYLGMYDDPEKAAIAYNGAAKALFGEHASLNIISGQK